MATKNTKDNTYYSLTKFFKFSSIMLILFPLVEVILVVVGMSTSGGKDLEKAIRIIGIITTVLIVIWVILNIIMFVFAGNLRGLKSPFGIRFGLLISMILAFAATIIYVLQWYHVIDIGGNALMVLSFVLPVLQMLGFIIAAVLSSKIKKALRN